MNTHIVQAVGGAVTCEADKDQIEKEKNQVGVVMKTKRLTMSNKAECVSHIRYIIGQ